MRHVALLYTMPKYYIYLREATLVYVSLEKSMLLYAAVYFTLLHNTKLNVCLRLSIFVYVCLY